MKEFENKTTGDVVDFYEFVMMALDKAEEECEEKIHRFWCNLTKEEQVSLFCEAYQDLEVLWKEINSKTV